MFGRVMCLSKGRMVLWSAWCLGLTYFSFMDIANGSYMFLVELWGNQGIRVHIYGSKGIGFCFGDMQRKERKQFSQVGLANIRPNMKHKKKITRVGLWR